MRERNGLLDFFKGIFAICIVFVHFPFPGAVGKIVASIGVVGVIFFFLISGYWSYDESGKNAYKLIVRFKRNLILTLVAVGVYFLFTVIEQHMLGTFDEWFLAFKNPVTYIRMIVLGDFELIHADQLWFMPALLYGYLILYVIEKKRLHKLFYTILPALLLLRICMETYTNSFSNISWLDWHFSGNFLVGALPVMVLGSFMHRHMEDIKAIPLKTSVLGSVVSILLVFLFVNIKVGMLDISQVFKIAAAAFAFMLCITYHKKVYSGIVCRFGEKYTLYMYLYHYLIGTWIGDLFLYFSLPQYAFHYILPFAALIVSAVVSAAIYNVKGIRQKQHA